MRMKTDPTHPTPPQPATSQVVLDTPSPSTARLIVYLVHSRVQGLMGDNVTGSSGHSAPVATGRGLPTPAATLS